METYITLAIKKIDIVNLFSGVHGEVKLYEDLGVSISYKNYEITWAQYDLRKILELTSTDMRDVSSMSIQNHISFSLHSDVVKNIIGKKLNIDFKDKKIRYITYSSEFEEFHIMKRM